MKKLLIAAAFYAGFANVAAQTVAPEQDNDLKTWYHKDFATTKVYGVNTANAYKFLESKGLKPKPVIVGVLDSGVEVDHPGLMKNMWKNPNEIPNNGKDDDGNGYVDDIYGWNFLGGKNGDIDVDNMEVTRVVKKFQPVFEGQDSAKNKENQAKYPDDFAMYMKSKEIFTKKSQEAKQNLQMYTMIDGVIPDMVRLLGNKTLTKENLATIKPSTQQEAMALQVLAQVASDPQATGKSADEVGKYMKDQMKEAIDYFKPQAEKGYNLDFDPRKEIVGDNYDDYSEKSYGNNHYEGPDAKHGTHVAGIIAGLANGKEPQYGVASRVAKIMTVRAVPDGDERDKDVANAIRYAVDNGAKVLNMSFGKPVSPGKNVVWDAFKYAESKGVLLVKAAGNENEDIAEHQYFPTNFKSQTDDKPFINNMIVVGANTNDADKLKASFSNYDAKMVDVFAPGDQIYSTVPDGKYEYLQGTSMASPVVAGAAAVLLAYMPNLTPAQVIESLVNTANKSTANGFDTLSRSNGVIDTAKAAEYAYAHFYKADNSSKSSKLPVKKQKDRKVIDRTKL
ncbi:Subtilase family protein [Epilithonimonas bovis DSM 19482]|uniref:Subtilase family protein n=1 Tax=Epilithonimonas bovis DSM 19482 TaxID=1121284 RepID=A0A1U7PZ62_9FLAO|nr:S8 family serine peptidase [Epilithonimonas bovis]SIT98047.1 Subtilase family protein [Epilithonimonas bovis DSM 19482]